MAARPGLVVSGGAHVALIAAGLFSLPSAAPLDSSQIEALPVELVTLSDTTDLSRGLQTALLRAEPAPNDPSEVENLRPSREFKPEPEPPQAAPPPPEQEPAAPAVTAVPEPEPGPEPVAEASPPPEPEPEEVPAPEPPAPEPDRTAAVAAPDAPRPRAKPRPPARPAAEPDPPAEALDDRQLLAALDGAPDPETQSDFDPDRIAALLDRPDPDGGALPSESDAALGVDQGPQSAQMTLSELDALRAKIKDCWFPPLGWTDPAEVRVVVRMSLNEDGTLAGQPIVVEAPNGQYARRAPESAVTALRRCAPYDLPPDKYQSWREVEIRFDPIEMYR